MHVAFHTRGHEVDHLVLEPEERRWRGRTNKKKRKTKEKRKGAAAASRRKEKRRKGKQRRRGREQLLPAEGRKKEEKGNKGGERNDGMKNQSRTFQGFLSFRQKKKNINGGVSSPEKKCSSSVEVYLFIYFSLQTNISYVISVLVCSLGFFR